jgi:hypothetical protein
MPIPRAWQMSGWMTARLGPTWCAPEGQWGTVDGLPDVVRQKVGGDAGSAWISDWPSVQAGIEAFIPGWNLYRGHDAGGSGTKVSSHVNCRFEGLCS